MSGSDVRRLAVTSSPKLSPDEIASRGFGRAVRGVSEQEVRSFLRRVAEEVGALADREAMLQARLRDLEERLANPPAPTEQQLLDALGEETARVLRSAQEAADDIRTRAEERAAEVLRDADERARATREAAEAEAEARTSAAEEAATALTAATEADALATREAVAAEALSIREAAVREATELTDRARDEGASEVEHARQTGRDMLAEAKAVRERVLADLARRRELLTAQIEELRVGRDRLLGAYRVVKQTLADATQALGQVEARGAAVLATPAPVLPEDAVEPAAAPDAEVPPAPVAGALAGAVAEAVAEEVGGTGAGESREPAATPMAVPARGIRRRMRDTFGIREDDAGTDAALEEVRIITVDGTAEGGEVDVMVEEVVASATGGTVAVDALFARLRADAIEPVPEPGPEPGTTPSEVMEREVPAPSADAAQPGAGPEVEPGPAVPELADDDDAVRDERMGVLAPLLRDALKRAKRALQDDQNEVLDRLRTVKGRPQADAVLGAADAQVGAWVALLAEPIGAAYTGAHTTHSTEPAPGVPDELVRTPVEAVVLGLRGRLADAAVDEDADAAVRAVGAAFREARGADLERALHDALAAAWARGVHDAAPAGSLLRWVPIEPGACADCDDNALEPTRRGEPFPTGQPHPPAHPGCRCTLTPVVASD